MIYVLTVHHRDDRFLGPQLDALDRHLSRPFKVCAVLDDVPRDPRIAWTVDPGGVTQHAPRLNALADDVVAVAAPDDLLVFLDGDAFPIADPLPLVDEALASGATLVAARRDEGVGAPWPHPLFCAVTAAWWAAYGDWRAGPRHECRNGRRWSDAGARLLTTLTQRGERWHPLVRTNTVNIHRLFFGVYGGLIYHHGAGFRRPLSKGEVAECGGDRARIERLAERNRRASAEMLTALRTDPEFWRFLCES